MKYKAAVFDMDGTILNTVDDLTDSLNYALAQCGHRSDFVSDQVRLFFGSGAKVAILRALAVERGALKSELEFIGTDAVKISPEDEAESEKILDIFSGYYPNHCDIKTGPYPGIVEGINELKKMGVATAVVSNKLDEAVGKLAVDYFPGIFDVAIGEKENVRRKPAPDMIEATLKKMGVSTEDAVYIGDSEIDLQTAENSHLPCISVDWGFRDRDFLIRHGADPIVSTADEMVACFRD